MTEKRFEWCADGIDMWDNQKEERIDSIDFEEAFNELAEENEQLKTVNTHLKNELSWIRDYAYWKEKDAFNKLWGAYMETCEEYRILVKENEQLKSKYSEQCTQLDFLKDENQHMRDLVNENEQLKFQNSNLMKEVAEYSRKAKELEGRDFE